MTVREYAPKPDTIMAIILWGTDDFLDACDWIRQAGYKYLYSKTQDAERLEVKDVQGLTLLIARSNDVLVFEVSKGEFRVVDRDTFGKNYVKVGS